MSELELSFEKSVEENASDYFEKSKRAKRKLEGLKKAIVETKARLAQMEKQNVVSVPSLVKKRKRKWFEDFHWFFSSDGFLVIGGRDAKSNETVVKKHLEKGDKFLHADIHGGSACVVKAEGKEVSEKALEEASVFAAVFSRAWKQGLSSVDVYAVDSEQVSKHAMSGESLGKGAFMIYGKRQWFRKTPLNIFVGLRIEDDCPIIVCGPEQAVKKNALAFVRVVQGSNENSKTAKEVLSFFEKKLGKKIGIHLDEIVSMLPAGGTRVVF